MNILSLFTGQSTLLIYGVVALVSSGIIGTMVYKFHYKPIKLLNKEIVLLNTNITTLDSHLNRLKLKLNNSEALLEECKDSIKVKEFEVIWSAAGDNLDKLTNELNDINDTEPESSVLYRYRKDSNENSNSNSSVFNYKFIF